MIPAHVKQYLPHIEKAAIANSHTHTVRPIVMAAILDQESQGGRTLKPPGPSGTGDFAIRTSQRYADNNRFRELTRAEGGTGFLPFDLKGFGRGLFQIDFGYHADWCLKQLGGGAFLWELPEYNSHKACEIFADALKHLGGDEDAAIAAYNCGWRKALEEVNMLTPLDDPSLRRQSRIIALDRATTNGSYLSSVLNKVDRFTESPDVPPPPRPGVA